jgi:hypothetical protein
MTSALGTLPYAPLDNPSNCVVLFEQLHWTQTTADGAIYHPARFCTGIGMCICSSASFPMLLINSPPSQSPKSAIEASAMSTQATHAALKVMLVLDLSTLPVKQLPYRSSCMLCSTCLVASEYLASHSCSPRPSRTSRASTRVRVSALLGFRFLGRHCTRLHWTN